MRLRPILLAAGCLFWVACASPVAGNPSSGGDAGSSPSNPDSGPGPGTDGGPATHSDAGEHDAGPRDAGEHDAGTPTPDAGTQSAPGLDGGIQLLLTPSSTGHVAFVDAINGASKSVHMVMYHLTDTQVTQALVNAHQRTGVDVKVILDESSLSESTYVTAYNTLNSAGVDVIKSSTAFDLTHEKSMVIDDKQAFITSMNMVDTYTTTLDYGIITTDASVIAEWESVFAADIVNAQNNTKNTPSLSDAALVWSPVNSNTKLTALVASANTSIIATVETIDTSTYITFAAALEAAARRGVNVRLITPECVENPNPLINYTALSTLSGDGISVRVMPEPSTATVPYVHGKMIVVDSHEAFVGSENYTDSSLTDDRECGILVTDATAVSTLGTNFEANWNQAIAIPNPLPTNCPAD